MVFRAVVVVGLRQSLPQLFEVSWQLDGFEQLVIEVIVLVPQAHLEHPQLHCRKCEELLG